MAYTINRFNGTVLTNVEDGTVDQTTDLKLIGKNYSGYGEAQNENFLFMLENFAGSSAPTKPISGMLWFDNTNNKIKVYDGAKWKPTGGAEVSATTPTGLSEGDLWWNSSSDQLYGLTDANDWILIGPQKAGTGTTEMQSLTIYDEGRNTHSVIAAILNDKIKFIISKDDDFTPDVNAGQTEITQAIKDATGVLQTVFPKIKKGITLADVDATTGVSTSTGINDDVLWGTAADALRLGGVPASSYRRSDQAIDFDDDGFYVGDGQDIRIYVPAADEGGDSETPYFKMENNKLSIQDATGNSNPVWTFKNTGLEAGRSGLLIGTSDDPVGTIYADTFNGQATAANSLAVSGTNRTASTAATNNTIAARDSSGNLTANIFTGTATKARYADLAEKYTVAEGVEHAVGTVMMIGRDSCCEMEPYQLQGVVAGVISEAPAYLMNAEIDGQAIALKGRVPVRVVYPIEKGQKLYAWSDGVASSIPTDQLVGIALEANHSQEEKLVEVFLKV